MAWWIIPPSWSVSFCHSHCNSSSQIRNRNPQSIRPPSNSAGSASTWKTRRPRRGCGVDCLLHGPEPNATLLNIGQLVNEMADGPAEPIHPPHNQRVTRPELVQDLRQFRAGFQRPRSRVGEDPVAAGRLQRVLPQGRVLVPGRYPGRAQQISMRPNAPIPVNQQKRRHMESGTEFRYKIRESTEPFECA